MTTSDEGNEVGTTPDVPNGPPVLRIIPKSPAMLTPAEETQRRKQKVTVGEMEDGFRNLMRVVKAEVQARDAVIRDLMAMVTTVMDQHPDVIPQVASDDDASWVA